MGYSSLVVVLRLRARSEYNEIKCKSVNMVADNFDLVLRRWQTVNM
jgi:hypothetical protein